MITAKLDSRIIIKRHSKTADGFGGQTSTTSTVQTIWAGKKEKSGEFKSDDGRARKYVEIELTVRKKTADTILDNDFIQIEGVTGDYQITEKFDSIHKYFTTIKAGKVG